MEIFTLRSRKNQSSFPKLGLLNFRLSVIVIFLFASFNFATAQEICNNGIDDDGNGLIDLNDTIPCRCNQGTTSLINNPSFEQNSGCPNTYGQMGYATSWIQPSQGTSDYYNTCNYTGSAPLPFPDGNACAGFFVFDYPSPSGFGSNNYREYVATCLNNPLLAGNQYTLNMNIASKPVNDYLQTCNGGNIFYGPINISIWGVTSCSLLSFPGTGCPSAPLLGSVSYTPSNSWATITITLSPSSNITGILVGACGASASYHVPSNLNGCYPYFFVDNLLFNEPSVTTSMQGNYCSNNIVLTASPTTTGTLQWYKNGIAIIGATANTYSVPAGIAGVGSYQVILTTGSTCKSSNITVVVNQAPTVSVNNATICAGTSTVLTGSGATTYSWNTGATTSTLSINPTTSTIYTITGTTGGCTNTKTVSVTVNPTPTVSVNNATICAGTSTVLTGSGATTYSWNTGATTSTLSINPTTSTIYTITGTTGGCTNTKTVSITVNPTPTVSVNNATICPGTSTVLTGSGATTYSWNTGATTSTLSVNPTTTTIYTITGTTGGCINTKTVSVIVNTTPTVSVNNATICAGTSTVLTGSGATTYSWNTGATTSTLSVNPTTTTIYTITGTTGGCINTKTISVTVNNTPTVNVNNATICSGNSATLTASGASNYSWNTGASSNSITVNPTSTTTYTILGTTGTCTNTATATVSVSAIPTVNVNSASICVGNSATLTATGATTYSWNTGATTNNITLNPSTTTSYTVIGATGTCTNTAIATITVATSLTVNVNSEIICAGSTVTLTASGATTYSWNTGASSDTITVNPTSSSTYTVIGTNGTCSDTTLAVVTVSASPTVNVSNTEICSGSSTVLTATGATTYSWSNGASTASISVNPSSTTSYSVTGSIGTCSDTAIANVTVNLLPNIPALNASNSTICSGDSVLITPTTTQSNVLYNVYNSSSGTPPALGVLNYNTGSLNNTTTYYVQALDTITGCVSSGSLAQITITVNPSPTNPVLSANDTSICPGDSVTITTSLFAANTTYSVYTNPLGTPPSIGALNYNTGTLNNNTTYYVLATDTITGCSSNGALAQITITVNALPNSPTVQFAANDSICAGNTATLSIQSPQSGVTYTIYDQSTGGSIMGTSPLTVTPSLTTTYYVQSVSAEGCVDTNNRVSAVITVIDLPDTTGLAVNINNATCSQLNGSLSIVNPNPAYTYNWYNAQNTFVGTGHTIPSLPVGVYHVTIQNSFGCVNSATAQTYTIDTTPALQVSFTMSPQSGIAPLQVQFTNTSNDTTNTLFTWSFGDNTGSTIISPSHLFQLPQGDELQYQVTLIGVNQFGCIDTFSVSIDVFEEGYLNIPNVFTPNNDKTNDVFYIKSNMLKDLHVDIFNRWGQILFSWDGLNGSWDGHILDGREAPDGTYYFLLTGQYKDKKSLEKQLEKQGTVTLIR